MLVHTPHLDNTDCHISSRPACQCIVGGTSWQPSIASATSSESLVVLHFRRSPARAWFSLLRVVHASGAAPVTNAGVPMLETTTPSPSVQPSRPMQIYHQSQPVSLRRPSPSADRPAIACQSCFRRWGSSPKASVFELTTFSTSLRSGTGIPGPYIGVWSVAKLIHPFTSSLAALGRNMMPEISFCPSSLPVCRVHTHS